MVGLRRFRLAFLARAIDRQTRNPGPLRIEGDLARKIHRLARIAKVPPETLVAVTKARATLIVRRDRKRWVMTFAFVTGPGTHIVVEYDWWSGRPAWLAKVDGVASTSGGPGPDLRNQTKPFEAPEARQRDCRIVHDFCYDRPYDAILHAIAIGLEIERRGWTVLPAHRRPGVTMVDPCLIGERLTIPTECVGLPEASVSHRVRSSGKRQSARQTRRMGRILFGAAEPDRRVLFISFETEKRAFAQELDCLVEALNGLAARAPSIETILVNGMTAPWDGRPADFFPDIEAREAQAIATIRAQLDRPLVFETLFGLSLADKAPHTARASFLIGPSGGATLLPNLQGVPGVTYINARRANQARSIDNAGIVRVPQRMIVQRHDLSGMRHYKIDDPSRVASYGIEPKAFAGFVLKHYERTAGYA